MSLLPWKVEPTKHHRCSCCWHTNYSILVGMNNITTFFLPWPISETNLLQRVGGFCCCNSPRSVSSPAVMFLMLLLLLFQCAHKNRVHLSVVCLPFLQPPLHTCGWAAVCIILVPCSSNYPTPLAASTLIIFIVRKCWNNKKSWKKILNPQEYSVCWNENFKTN